MTATADIAYQRFAEYLRYAAAYGLCPATYEQYIIFYGGMIGWQRQNAKNGMKFLPYPEHITNQMVPAWGNIYWEKDADLMEDIEANEAWERYQRMRHHERYPSVTAG